VTSGRDNAALERARYSSCRDDAVTGSNQVSTRRQGTSLPKALSVRPICTLRRAGITGGIKESFAPCGGQVGFHCIAVERALLVEQDRCRRAESVRAVVAANTSIAAHHPRRGPAIVIRHRDKRCQRRSHAKRNRVDPRSRSARGKRLARHNGAQWMGTQDKSLSLTSRSIPPGVRVRAGFDSGRGCRSIAARRSGSVVVMLPGSICGRSDCVRQPKQGLRIGFPKRVVAAP
jgi:hypothetical protein